MHIQLLCGGEDGLAKDRLPRLGSSDLRCNVTLGDDLRKPAFVLGVKLVAYRSLYFFNLFKFDSNGIEHWLGFVQITYSMSCQVYGAFLMVGGFEFSVVS